MISEKTLQHPILVLMIFALLGVMGTFILGNVAISLMPDVDNPVLSVSATYRNAGPESVEKSVTRVIEDALVGLSSLEKMTSTSSEGASSVSLTFKYGTNLEKTKNDVRDKLTRISSRLPDGVSTNIMQFSSDSSPIMRIALNGNRSANDLKAIADNYIVDILEQADGVGEATSSGGRTEIVRVELEQNRLAAYGLTLSQVSNSLASENLELGGGTITEGTTNYSIRTVGEYKSIEEINDTVITSIKGYDIKLSDIGRAFMGYQDTTSEVYINGKPGVYISVTKQSGSNSVTVANAVYEKIEEAKKVIPNDVSLEIISDSTIAIRDTISSLVESAAQGLLLAVIVLFIFLCNFKSTIIIAISIPLSMVITLLCMYFAGITLNMMTLTGLILGVGMIVDASIVMIDNIYSYRSRGTKPNVAAILGSQEMIMSVISGNLTTICVFIPFLFFISELGMMGQMFKGIIFTVVIALLSSLLVAIFLVPVLAGHFLPLTNRNEKPVKNVVLKVMYALFNKGQNFIQAIYGKMLKAALNNRAITIIICVFALAVSIMFIPTMKIQMMTGGSDDSVTLNISLPIGTSLAQTSSVINEFQQIIENEIKGYKVLITSIGTGRGSRSYTGSIQIQIGENGDNSQQIQTKLRPHFADYTDVTFSFGRGMRRQLTGDDIKISLRGDDIDQIVEVATLIEEVMAGIPDIGEPSLDTTEGLPQVEIEIDRERAYNFGVNVQTVANEINYCINGKTSTTYRKNGTDHTVYVMLRPEDRSQVIDLEQIFVKGSSGLVSVANFAKVKKGLGPVSIARENRRRIVHLSANILTDENANIIEEKIKEGIENSFVIPEGINISYEGSWKNMKDQSNTYLKIILMAIILVFGVMAATYESFKAPFINLMTIPFLIIGVIAIYKIKGQVVSLTSAIGLIMLVGIVVNNGIILVDYTNLLIDRGMKMLDACYAAGCSRVRPVLMTTLTTILGMIPMCLSSDGNASMVQPIGIAVVGGLTSSTFITLFFIPVLYSLVMKEKTVAKSRIQVDLPTNNATTETKKSGLLAKVLEEQEKLFKETMENKREEFALDEELLDDFELAFDMPDAEAEEEIKEEQNAESDTPNILDTLDTPDTTDTAESIDTDDNDIIDDFDKALDAAFDSLDEDISFADTYIGDDTEDGDNTSIDSNSINNNAEDDFVNVEDETDSDETIFDEDKSVLEENDISLELGEPEMTPTEEEIAEEPLSADIIQEDETKTEYVETPVEEVTASTDEDKLETADSPVEDNVVASNQVDVNQEEADDFDKALDAAFDALDEDIPFAEMYANDDENNSDADFANNIVESSEPEIGTEEPVFAQVAVSNDTIASASAAIGASASTDAGAAVGAAQVLTDAMQKENPVQNIPVPDEIAISVVEEPAVKAEKSKIETTAQEPVFAETTKAEPVASVQKRPEADEAKNDHHIDRYKKLKMITSKPTVTNSEQVSTGTFVSYKPARNG